MPTRRVLRGVLQGFLGTYTSRYSDYDGYWLFGFLVGDLSAIEFDLLATSDTNPLTTREAAKAQAILKFSEQLAKAGLDPARLLAARLSIERLPGALVRPINGHRCSGHNLCFCVSVTTDTGKRFDREQIVFVAAHNEAVEHRSNRASDAPRCT